LDILWARYQLTEQTANQYLLQFRNMSLYFPFVVVPSSVSLEELATNRPMQCLAILTASAGDDRQLQNKLEDMLRKNLMERMMVDNEKTLDLLAALLVYLGWYHFYYVPKMDMMSQLLSLAVSICEDLGLEMSPEEVIRHKSLLRLEHHRIGLHEGEQNDLFFSREARRLFLGTQYIVCK